MPGLHPGGELPCRLFCLGLVGLVLERCADGGGGAAEDQDGPAEDEKKYLSTIPTEINCAFNMHIQDIKWARSTLSGCRDITARLWGNSSRIQP